MKSSIAYAFTLIATGFVAAVDISSLPGCATPCALSSLPSICTLSDYNCYCHNSSWLSSMAPCVKKNCNEDEQKQVVTIAQSLCGQYSVTIPNDYLSTAVASGSASTPTASATTGTGSPTTTASGAARTSSNAAVLVQVGSGLMAAAAGVAMFVV